MKQLSLFLFLFIFSTFLWAQSNIEVKRVTASSVYPADSANYRPENAIDRNNNTAWFPQRTSRANKGEWIKFDFEEGSLVAGIKIINGWISSRGNWRHNSRVKTMTIELSSGFKKTVVLKDSMSVQQIDFPTTEASWLKIVIQDIYAGDRWNQESGITQVSILGSTKEQLRLAKIEEEKSKERARLARLSEEKQAKEKAAYLAKHRALLDKKLASLDPLDFLTFASDSYKTETYPEAKKQILTILEKSIERNIKALLENPNSQTSLAAYDAYKSSIFGNKFQTSIASLYETAFDLDFNKAKSKSSSEEVIAVYKKYTKYKNDNPYANMIEVALEIDANTIEQNPISGSTKSIFDKYQDIELTTSAKIKYQRLIGSYIDKGVSAINNTQELTPFLDGVKNLPLNLENKKRINNSILKIAGIEYRETFREGKIGERYVPSISKSQSYNETRYINGVAINETKFNDYTTGGYDESRYGYTAVYQLFNESDKTYLVDVEISASVKSTEYRTQSSWSGDDQKVSVNKTNELTKRVTYVLKAGSELKDQIIVGETKPSDFIFSVLNISAVEAAWFDNLTVAINGEDLSLAKKYFFDDKAKYWKPEIAGNLARLAYMNIDKSLSTGDKFDRDFKSPVSLVIKNNNDFAIELGLSNNFNARLGNVQIGANQTFRVTLTALGRRKDDLEVTVEMLEPVVGSST
jgi:hypothetical protein